MVVLNLGTMEHLMCLYSASLRADQFRDAKAEGEDLTIANVQHGHHAVRSSADKKIVCMKPGTKVHFDKVELNPHLRAGLDYRLVEAIEGKKLSGTFVEWRNGTHSMAMDAIEFDIDGDPRSRHFYKVHIVHLAVGCRLYTGDKRVDLVASLGACDPSIVLDHMNPDEQLDSQAPIVERALARVGGLCSIRR